MIKILLFVFFAVSIENSYSQKILQLKKKGKIIRTYYPGSYITFQMKDGEWVKGIITEVRADSFYLKTERITYTMFGADTTHFSGFKYAFEDVYKMPKKGVKIDYAGNTLVVKKSAGHQHWYWIKSGWLFRTAAIGYLGLDLMNGVIKNDYTFSAQKVGISSAVFMLGLLLKKTYKISYRIDRKYQFQVFEFPKH